MRQLELFLLAVVLLMQGACICMTLYKAVVHGEAIAGKVASRFLGWRRGGFAGVSEDSEVVSMTQLVLAAKNLKLAKLGTFIAWSTSCLMSTQVLVEAFAPDRGLLHCPESLALRLTMLGLLSVAVLVPKACGRLLVHALCMAVLGALALIEVDADHLQSKSSWTSAVALALSCLALNFPVLLVTHSFVSGCHIVSLASGRQSVEDSQVTTMVGLEIFHLLERFLLCLGAELVLEAWATAEAELSIERCRRSAESSLLGMMCDAVVDLDESCRFKKHDSKFAGMVLIDQESPAQDKSVRGRLLSEFVHDREDTVLLERTLQEGLPRREEGFVSPATPSMITVWLVNSVGQQGKTALFHAPYLSPLGEVHHLVGLREEADSAADRPAGLRGGFGSARGAELRSDVVRGLLQKTVMRSRSSLAVVANDDSSGGDASGEGASDGADVYRLSKEGGTSPEVRLVAEVYVQERLPIRWARQDFFEVELGLERHPHDFYGVLSSSNGGSLLDQIKDCIERAKAKRSRGHFVKDLGEFEMTCPDFASKGHGVKVIHRRLWADFRLPVYENHLGVPYVTIAASGNKANDSGEVDAMGGAGGGGVLAAGLSMSGRQGDSGTTLWSSLTGVPAGSSSGTFEFPLANGVSSSADATSFNPAAFFDFSDGAGLGMGQPGLTSSAAEKGAIESL